MSAPSGGSAPTRPAAPASATSATPPDTVATPEGDNEFAPGQPLTPAPDGLQRTPAIDTNKV